MSYLWLTIGGGAVICAISIWVLRLNLKAKDRKIRVLRDSISVLRAEKQALEASKKYAERVANMLRRDFENIKANLAKGNINPKLLNDILSGKGKGSNTKNLVAPKARKNKAKKH